MTGWHQKTQPVQGCFPKHTLQKKKKDYKDKGITTQNTLYTKKRNNSYNKKMHTDLKSNEQKR